jgi:FkbM family methyltransferase
MPATRLDATSGGKPGSGRRGRRVTEELQRMGRELGYKSYLLAERRLAATMSKWAARYQGQGPAVSPQTTSLATLDDVMACYRLVLGRPADPDGLAHYGDRIASGELTAQDLAGEFLGSVEFARAHPQGPHGGPSTTEVVTTCEGFRIHVDPTDYAVGHTVARTGSYEPEVSATLREVLEKGATFVDIGANIGWFSLLGASLVGPAGRVIAVEPNPLNVALLRRSAEDNGFDNIEVLEVALADAPGVVALETDGSNGRVIAINGPPPKPVAASFVVATYPLDALLDRAGVGRVDTMKIDVEGAEPLVLRGATKMLARDRPVIISEFFPLALDSSPGGSAESYLDLLRQFGYRLSVIGTDGDQDDAGIMSLAREPGKDQVDLLAWPLSIWPR